MLWSRFVNRHWVQMVMSFVGFSKAINGFVLISNETIERDLEY
ncbi:Uncharacterized protein APZ42_030140 [Daphnia magna]|uniref:Uncharacterized protein n=1 Tax=Daphnia magna TaxID=35525 RepID=A0A164P0Z5_9CRUS|nr:Uncharacterized protein APZ42_030140 [Daphnia magna]